MTKTHSVEGLPDAVKQNIGALKIPDRVSDCTLHSLPVDTQVDGVAVGFPRNRVGNGIFSGQSCPTSHHASQQMGREHGKTPAKGEHRVAWLEVQS